MGSLTNLINFLKGPALTGALLFTAAIVASKAHKKDFHGTLTSAGIVVVCLGIVALAVVPGARDQVGTFMTDLIFH